MIDYNSEGIKRALSDLIQKSEDTPIYKGCRNETCYCTGACKKVIGYIKPDGTKIFNKQNELGENEIGKLF